MSYSPVPTQHQNSYRDFGVANQQEVCYLENRYMIENDQMVSRAFDKECDVDWKIYPPFYTGEGSCALKPEANTEVPDWKIGYRCLDGSQYLHPDRENTFHNYLVLQENELRCSENHQVFNNWTKRKKFSDEPPVQKGPPLPPPLPEPELCDITALLQKRPSVHMC